MNYESLPESEWAPMTRGMTFHVPGDKALARFHLEKGDSTGVTFSHKRPDLLPDDELLQLT